VIGGEVQAQSHYESSLDKQVRRGGHLDEAKEARANLKKFLREVMMGVAQTAEAREPLHSYPEAPEAVTALGRWSSISGFGSRLI